jgi:hypothetical protein
MTLLPFQWRSHPFPFLSVFSVLSDETLPFYFILQLYEIPPSTGHFR